VFERALVAALPLAAGACDEGHDQPHDAGVSAPPPDQAVQLTPPDDLALTLPDHCEQLHPVVGVDLDGGLPDALGDAQFFNDYPWCGDYCPSGYVLCHASRRPQFDVICAWDCTGRRPAGLAEAVAPDPVDGCAIGRYWARMAHLEAASVPAFARLGRELVAHGAPAALRRAAERARRDEVRHARLTARLARAHGVAPPAVALAAQEPRSLEAMARENAVEGCVRETFGALVAAWQARAAADPGVRRAMAKIARDERRHAELAWAVDRWAARRLGATARRRVAAARREAALALAATDPTPATGSERSATNEAVADELGAAAGETAPLMRQLGLPDAAQTRRLWASVAGDLWAI
jgi:hypothetical protein